MNKIIDAHILKRNIFNINKNSRKINKNNNKLWFTFIPFGVLHTQALYLNNKIYFWNFELFWIYLYFRLFHLCLCNNFFFFSSSSLTEKVTYIFVFKAFSMSILMFSTMYLCFCVNNCCIYNYTYILIVYSIV